VWGLRFIRAITIHLIRLVALIITRLVSSLRNAKGIDNQARFAPKLAGGIARDRICATCLTDAC
jgi:hypothetical protein